MLENAMKAKVYYAVLALAMRNDPVVGQMVRRCLEDNTWVDYVELGDIYRVGIKAESIEQECPLDPIIGGAQQHLFYFSFFHPDLLRCSECLL